MRLTGPYRESRVSRPCWHYAIAALVLASIAFPLPADPTQLLVLLPFALGMVYVDRWVNWVATHVQWSYGSVVAIAAMVILPHGYAAFVGSAFGVLGAFTDQEIEKPKLSRIVLNAGQLGIAGAIGGFVFEALRPPGGGPSLGLVGATLAAVLLITSISGILVVVAIRVGFGTRVAPKVAAATLLLGWRKVVASVAVAVIASTIGILGDAWIVFAIIQIVALGAVPVVRARLEARRRDIMRAVTSALNARGVVGSAHDHLESTAVTLGHRLALTSDQIEQIRYLALIFAMTDNFAVSFPRSVEDRLRGLDDGAFSSAILLGLPLNDVADPVVVRIAEAAAEYEAMVRPFDEDEEPLTSNEAAAVLLRTGADPYVVAALLDEQPLPSSYVRVWEIDPGSPWRRPMKWIAEKSLPIRGAAR